MGISILLVSGFVFIVKKRKIEKNLTNIINKGTVSKAPGGGLKNKERTFQLESGHLIGCDKKSEIVRYFQGRLCDKIGLLCNFFRANLHCFTRFQRRKTTLMLFNRQFECKGIIKHLF